MNVDNIVERLPVIDGLPESWDPANAISDFEDAALRGGTARDIVQVGLMLTHLLLKKNAAYGDSALNPLSVFSQAEVRERLSVRMDDKLNRIAKGQTFGMENERVDLAGYLILDYIAAHRGT